MIRPILLRLAGLALVFAIAVSAGIGAARADDPSAASLIQEFGTAKSFSDVEKIVKELATAGNPDVARALQALSDGNLYVRNNDHKVFIARFFGNKYTLFDPITGNRVGDAWNGTITKIKVKNSIRVAVRDALGSLTLGAKDPAKRLAAANSMVQSADADQIPILDKAIARETVPAIKTVMQEARAAAILKSDRPVAEKKLAIDTIAARGDRDARAMLTNFVASTKDAALKAEAQSEIDSIDWTIRMWNAAQTVWYGLSLGSVLLLAAIGLAITFGVMGVINMAHGEMVMLGAYTTFVVQQVIRAHAPELFAWSLPIALPLAFLVSGAVGLVIERGIIRFLYGRPLETLLATFGVSLVLQQAVRSIFGPTNQDVGNPGWMSGAFNLGMMQIT